ncbi:MAG: ferritin-like domain-containing protein, partial [Chloroflexi bacterium]|nr:ferritin-like domain-containing protein [Chloroflexota bacterium]
YHEVKNFLATGMFDAARHCEVFRKRALVNGGGLGLESKGDVNRMILESKGGWTETVLFLHLLRGTFTMTIYRYGDQFAHNLGI